MCSVLVNKKDTLPLLNDYICSERLTDNDHGRLFRFIFNFILYCCIDSLNCFIYFSFGAAAGSAIGSGSVRTSGSITAVSSFLPSAHRENAEWSTALYLPFQAFYRDLQQIQYPRAVRVQTAADSCISAFPSAAPNGIRKMTYGSRNQAAFPAVSSALSLGVQARRVPPAVSSE